MASRLSTLGYNRARQLILAAGLIVLLVVAALMYVRRIDPIEVYGTLLFIPIFLAFVWGGLRGGLIAGFGAALVYLALRYGASDQVGFGRFAGLTVSRAVAYIAFGTIGGIANAQLGASLTKLDLFDQVDDATGLFNARFFVDNTGLEIERSGRYQTIFCVVVVDVPGDVLAGLSKRNRDRAIKELGRTVKEGIRTVDRGVHAVDGEKHRFATILPETGRDGGRVFAGRLVEKMIEILSQRGATDPQRVKFDLATYPGDEEDLQEFRRDFASLEALEHPESAHTA